MSEVIQIKTELPGPESRRLLERRTRAVPVGVFQTAPIFAERAQNAVITDVDGNSFLDFAGGIGVLNVGSANEGVTAAVVKQARKFLHTCFHVVMYEPYLALAEKLAEVTPGDHPKKTLLVNSGAEAVENAVKIARKFTGRQTIITLENAFHGRTMMAMTLTSKVMPYKAGFGPFAPEVVRVPSAYCYRCAFGLDHPSCGFRCVENLDRVIRQDVGLGSVAALIAEPVQGEGGFIVPPAGYFERIRDLCRTHGMLLIADEIQTGFGRTGRMFAIEHSQVVPDMVLVAKSLGAGLPIAGVVGRAEIMDSVHVGGIGGTYGGNPVACAAALEVISQMKGGLVARGEALGRRLRALCEEMRTDFPLVGDVRGLGAMVAMELVKDRRTREPAADETSRVIQEAYKRGVILVKAGIQNNVIRFLMPLTIPDDQLVEGMAVVREALAAANRVSTSARPTSVQPTSKT